MLKRLASFSFRHRWIVLFAWIAAVVGATVLAGSSGGEFASSSRLPGTDSDEAYQLLAKEFPADETGDSFSIVFHDETGGVTQTDIDGFLADVSKVPGVISVTSPFEGDPASSIAADGQTALAEVVFDDTGDIDLAAAATEIDALAEPLRGAGTAVAFNSYWFESGGLPNSELIGLAAAVVILLLAFGSLIAMGLPLITALVGIAIGLAGVELWAAAVDTPEFTVQVASMVGIGVGIDYALFIVTRFREAAARGLSPFDATMEAIGTAGRAVVFAGCTVVISLMGMFLMRLSFLNGLALGTASAVLVAVFAAITLLPALLSFCGKRLARQSVKRSAKARRETVWHRWSRLVQRHPKGFAIGGLAVLLAAGAPTLAMRLAVADAGNNPVDSTNRQAYDFVADGFGPGANGPLVITVETPTLESAAASQVLSETLGATPGIAFASPTIPSESGQASLISVVPATSPQDAATFDLVHDIRTDLIPASGLVAHVGGVTASDIDFSAQMADRLPYFIGAVLLLSFLLLMAVFRSILVPLKAVVLNLLSIGAAYGVMVAVFQWGWAGSLFGVEAGAPIEPWAPMMLFAIVFGLSMDYEVFLLSSVKERYDATRDNSSAVVEGLAATARVITAAAAIMVCVFGPFVFGDERAIKLIGLGLATAVFVDATIVRMILVPATMELLGARNWWMPRWLDRLVPHITVEETSPEVAHMHLTQAGVQSSKESLQQRSDQLVH
jgi:putative drug exporter of the RND superfamily